MLTYRSQTLAIKQPGSNEIARTTRRVVDYVVFQSVCKILDVASGGMSKVDPERMKLEKSEWQVRARVGTVKPHFTMSKKAWEETLKKIRAVDEQSGMPAHTVKTGETWETEEKVPKNEAASPRRAST